MIHTGYPAMRFLACHNDLVAAFMLGAIKRSINNSQDGRTRRAMLREDCYAD